MRSKQATKTKILEAAKVVLSRDGFEGLKVNALAEEAGVGKPLIYRYFNGLGGVVEALAHEAGHSSSKNVNEIVDLAADEVLQNLLVGGRSLAANRLARDLLLWSLASSNAPNLVSPSLDFEGGLSVESVTKDGEDKQAVFAILKAAIAFVVLYRDRHDSWAGLPIETPNQMARMERALAKIVAKVWKS